MLIVRTLLGASNRSVPVDELRPDAVIGWLSSEPNPIDLRGAIEILADGEVRLDREVGHAFVVPFWSSVLRALSDILDGREYTEAALAFSTLKFRVWDDGSVTSNYESAGPISKRIFLFASPLPEVMSGFMNAAGVFYSSMNEAAKGADTRFNDEIGGLRHLQDKWNAVKPS